MNIYIYICITSEWETSRVDVELDGARPVHHQQAGDKRIQMGDKRRQVGDRRIQSSQGSLRVVSGWAGDGGETSGVDVELDGARPVHHQLLVHLRRVSALGVASVVISHHVFINQLYKVNSSTELTTSNLNK
jgi:hypothetical protein